MKLIIQGSVIDTEMIYEVGKIEIEVGKMGIKTDSMIDVEISSISFKINFLNNNSMTVGIQSNLEQQCEQKEVNALTEARNELIQLWQGSKSPLHEIKIIDRQPENTVNVPLLPFKVKDEKKLFPDWMKKIDRNFLVEIQWLHDDSSFWSDTGLSKDGERKVKTIIDKYNLKNLYFNYKGQLVQKSNLSHLFDKFWHFIRFKLTFLHLNSK